MLKKIAAAVLITAFLITGLGACHSVGKATGKAVKTIKEAPGEFKEGYEEGAK